MPLWDYPRGAGDKAIPKEHKYLRTNNLRIYLRKTRMNLIKIVFADPVSVNTLKAN